jgi:pyruvate/2-oxoglutarate dehydrogenase complex dihydrolipoamide acyltransferase (E2) component
MSEATEIKWDGEGVAVLTQWFFDNGDSIAEGDVLCELMQEKTAFEVEAPVSGKLQITAAVIDAEILPGMTIALITG